MDHWFEPSVFSSTYYIAALRDLFFQSLMYIPIVFLLIVRKSNKMLYQSYKYTIFVPTFTYCILWIPYQFATILLAVHSYFETNPVPILYCNIIKVLPAIGFGYSYDCMMLMISVHRLSTIVVKRPLPIWLSVIFTLLLCSRAWIYLFDLFFYGYMSPNDACSPKLSSDILGGYLSYSIWLWSLNILTCIINVVILVSIRLQYCKSTKINGRTDTFYEHKLEHKMVAIGLLSQGIVPVITQAVSLWQSNVSSRLGIELSSWVINVSMLVSRTNSFLRAILPFLFIRSFQREFIRIVTKSKGNLIVKPSSSR